MPDTSPSMRERGLSRAEDEALLAIARDERSTIVTFDSDFARCAGWPPSLSPERCQAAGRLANQTPPPKRQG